LCKKEPRNYAILTFHRQIVDLLLIKVAEKKTEAKTMLQLKMSEAHYDVADGVLGLDRLP
jgi:hypothetical protein